VSEEAVRVPAGLSTEASLANAKAARIIDSVILGLLSLANQAIHDQFMKTWVAAPEGTTQLHLS